MPLRAVTGLSRARRFFLMLERPDERAPLALSKRSDTWAARCAGAGVFVFGGEDEGFARGMKV